MRKVGWSGIFLAAALGAVPGGAWAQSATLGTTWRDFDGTQQQCLTRANAMMQSLGYSGVETVGTSTFAISGDYRLLARCLADKRIVFFVAVGPSRAECLRLSEYLANQF